VLDPICERHNATLPQIALAWLLHRSPIMLPIPGTANPSHLEENLDAAAITLTTDEVGDITRLRAEPSDARGATDSSDGAFRHRSTEFGEGGAQSV
jgi:aryl-alcohol dehydrogenase-like predicted oxidoreductase